MLMISNYNQIKMKNSFIHTHKTNMKQHIAIAVLSLFTILTPIKPFVICITLFVAADTIFALAGNIKKFGIKAFKSNKLFNLVIKTFFYCGSIILLYMIDKHIFEGSILGIKLLLTKTATLLWCYIEIKSLDETSMKFFGNKSVWVLLKELFAKGKEIKKDLGEIIDDDKKSSE
jgi:energy-coupling factor transporter transmembrane protein EcfT